ncbi:MAG TPA: tetratricopeptide repeat protein [Candidatus Saccharimonadales bacterium]|nr:tetratricopeptide repeat protein [Candidatus Saccharimonadales bacterium]
MTRRRPAAALLVVIFAILGLPNAFAQDPEAVGSPSVESALREMWFARRDALLRGDTAAAAANVESMRRVIRTERLDRVPWLARAFTFEGYERLREGNYERAREAFDIARHFDHRASDAQAGYAWAALRAGRGFVPFLREYRRALWLRWDAFVRDSRANAYIVLIVALWLVSAAVVLVFLVRYNGTLRHDVEEHMPHSMPDGMARVAGWIVLFAPLMLWLGGAWLLLYWCVALARYMSGSERVAAALVCVAVLATGPLAAESARAARHASDPTLLAMEEALDGGYGKGVIHALQSALQEDPNSVTVRLLLANTYQHANLNREAFEEYRRVLSTAPDDPLALNNVGTLYMKTGQIAQGLVYFSRAVEVAKENPAVYYNLNLAQSGALRLDAAEATLKQLQQMDPNLAESLVEARGRGEEPAAIPLWISRDQVSSYLANRITSRDTVDTRALLGAPTAIGAMVAVVLLGWSSLLSRSPSRAQICIRCGAPFCGRCKREIGAKECCAQCIHLFVKKDAIAPDVRAAKLRQVDRFARMSRVKVRIASILLPGAGHMLAGRTLAGLVVAILWLVPVAILLLRGRLIMTPDLSVTGIPALSVIAVSVLMASAWIGANLLGPRTPS